MQVKMIFDKFIYPVKDLQAINNYNAVWKYTKQLLILTKHYHNMKNRNNISERYEKDQSGAHTATIYEMYALNSLNTSLLSRRIPSIRTENATMFQNLFLYRLLERIQETLFVVIDIDHIVYWQ